MTGAPAPAPAPAGSTPGAATEGALPESGRQARFAAGVALAEKASEVVVLDLRGLAGFTDFFVIATADSERRRRTVAEAVERGIREEFGRKPTHLEGYPSAGWLLADYVDFVVHIFAGETRDLYQLERLWGDAERWVPERPPADALPAAPTAGGERPAAGDEPPAAGDGSPTAGA